MSQIVLNVIGLEMVDEVSVNAWYVLLGKTMDNVIFGIVDIINQMIVTNF